MNLLHSIFLLVLLYIVLPNSSTAQGENNVWAFGDSMGLDFNSGSPILIRTAAATFEGCASICDSRGQLMFYCNQQKIWGRDHHVLPNGDGIKGEDMSTTMGTVIAASIYDTNIYYVFTMTSGSVLIDVANLYYTVVDRRLNGGLGDVVSGMKNIILDTGMTEKMVLAQSDECSSLWLLAHHRSKAEFRAYKITAAGISAPVISSTGRTMPENSYVYGNMDISDDYSLIALNQRNHGIPIGYTGVVSALELYDFDKSSGRVSNFRTIDSTFSVSSDFNAIYWITLSPNKSKLYCNAFSDGLFQYDLSLPSPAAVSASRTKLVNECLSLARGPDHKVYFLSNTATMQNICRINYPDLAGAACAIDTPISTPISIRGGFSMNNNTAAAKRMVTHAASVDSIVCMDRPVYFEGPEAYDQYIWSDGTKGRTITFNEPGTKLLYAYRGRCELQVDTFTVRAARTDSFFSKTDVHLCFADQYEAVADSGFSKYLWSDGSSAQTSTFFNSGRRVVYAGNQDCKLRVDSFHVDLIRFESGLPETDSVCGKPIELRSTTTDASFLWFDGSTAPAFVVNNAGIYSIAITKNNCTLNDTVLVENKNFNIALGNDIVVCNGSNIQLTAIANEADFQWQDGTTGPVYIVTEDGNYSVIAQTFACIAYDTVEVRFTRCEQCIALPSLFTPNQDQKNDFFGPITFCTPSTYFFSIYNRYGQQIFHTENINNKWDGRFNGQDVDIGVYYYLIKVHFNYPGAKEELMKGDITLLR